MELVSVLGSTSSIRRRGLGETADKTYRFQCLQGDTQTYNILLVLLEIIAQQNLISRNFTLEAYVLAASCFSSRSKSISLCVFNIPFGHMAKRGKEYILHHHENVRFSSTT
jgi:hypothetical protein